MNGRRSCSNRSRSRRDEAASQDDGKMLRRFSPSALRRARPSVSSPEIPRRFSGKGVQLEKDSDSIPSDLDSPTDQNAASFLPATPYVFVRILSAAAKSSSPTTGEQYHSSVVKLGFNSNLFVCTALLGLYCKSYMISSAQQLFEEMPHRNVVTWNTLIHGHSQSHLPALAVATFVEMTAVGVSPTPYSISSVLVACSQLEHPVIGAMLHGISFKHGFCSNVVVGTALVVMYSKCSDMCGARRVFDEMPDRNSITWASLVTGYSLDQGPGDAMLLVREMKHLGVGVNNVTCNSLLSSFSRHGELGHGKQVHCLVIKEGLDSDPYIAVTLVTMYSKWGSLEDFVKQSPAVSPYEQISCNSIIAGFFNLGDDGEVLERFTEMRKELIALDFFTFASVLRAIGILFAFEEGRQTHALILKTGNSSNVCVQNGLVSTYAKCGAINDSKQLFSSMNEHDLISWNSLLSGCAHHGYGREAAELFEQMREIGVRPDRTTFLSVLTACSHVGLVEKGLEYFYMMEQDDPPIVAGLEHYACVVDLLGRAGYLDEAEAFVNRMPIKPGVWVYRSLLSACQVQGNVEIAKRAAEQLFELCPNDPSAHVLLSNVFAADGCWENAAGLRRIMRGEGVRKKPAWTLIENRIIKSHVG